MNENVISKFVDEMKLNGLQDSTIKTYRLTAKSFLDYFDKPFDEISDEEIRDYFLYSLNESKSGLSYYNIKISCVKLLLDLLQKRKFKGINYIKTNAGDRLPVVLTKDEIKSILYACGNLKHKTLLAVIYSAGLRVSEAVKLTVSDIESKRKLIKVNQGKGNKDRYALLADTTLVLLRDYYRTYRPTNWLFEGQKPSTHLSVRSVELFLSKAVKKAGVKKENVTVHSLRHSCATHMLNDGVDIRKIQVLLGHKSIHTTTIYAAVSVESLGEIKSPFDNFI